MAWSSLDTFWPVSFSDLAWSTILRVCFSQRSKMESKEEAVDREVSQISRLSLGKKARL